MTSSYESQVSGFFVEVRSILCAESVDFIGSRKSEQRRRRAPSRSTRRRVNTTQIQLSNLFIVSVNLRIKYHIIRGDVTQLVNTAY